MPLNEKTPWNSAHAVHHCTVHNGPGTKIKVSTVVNVWNFQTSQTFMHYQIIDVWGQRIYLCAINNKIFFLCFFPFIIPLATQLFPLRLHHQTYETTSAIYGAPPFAGHRFIHFVICYMLNLHTSSTTWGWYFKEIIKYRNYEA